MTRSLPAAALAVLALLALSPTAGAVTFTVDATTDEADDNLAAPACDTGLGDCTLRAAIQQANFTLNGTFNDEIHFDIGGSGGPQTITVATQLPSITENLSVLGLTQPPAGETPLVTVNGPGTGVSAPGFHFELNTANSVIEGLLIQDFNTGIQSEVGGLSILNNYIGIQADGDIGPGIGNGTGVRTVGQSDSLGDSFSGDGNVISGNGIGIEDDAASGPQITDTLIGLTPDGLSDAGNTSHGIVSEGGLTAAASGATANFISGNGGDGILITGGDDVFVVGNRIGVDTAGNAEPNGGQGVAITGGTQNVFQGNLIANNGGAGLRIAGGSGVSPQGLGHNLFIANGGLGIDLGSEGVTPNDGAGDGDSGANGLQNFPVIDTAVPSGAGAQVAGTLTSAANREYDIQFFASPACDASGNGEGAAAAGEVTVTTTAQGVASFNLPVIATQGQVITAVASDVVERNMSEFSACRTVTAPGGPVLPAFGPDPLISLALAAKRIKAKGPVKVIVSNRNSFAVTGRLSGATAKAIATTTAKKKKKKRKRKVKLKAKAFQVAASGKTTVSLKLPKKLRRVLKRKRKLSLKLTALARDPAGNERTVVRTLKPKLKKKRKRKGKR